MLQDTCNKMPSQNHELKSQENQEEIESEGEYPEEENMRD